MESQKEISEHIAGRLVPGEDPTPDNACLKHGQNPSEYQILMIIGDNAFISSFPATIWAMGNTRIVGVDQVAGTQDLSLYIDFRDEQNHILLRVDKDGEVNRSSSLTLLHPSKNVFLIEDAFGNEFLRATYVNPHVFQISGNLFYCGQIHPLGHGNMHEMCFGATGSGVSLYSIGPACPSQTQQK